MAQSVRTETTRVDIDTNTDLLGASTQTKKKAPPPPERLASLTRGTRAPTSQPTEEDARVCDGLVDLVIAESDVSSSHRDGVELFDVVDAQTSQEVPSAVGGTGLMLRHSPVSTDVSSGRELIDSMREKSVNGIDKWTL